MAEDRVATVLLAAGGSKRLGFPKALARFGRRTALQIAAENVRAARLRPPIVVLGHAAEFLRPYADEIGARVVVNVRWQTGGQISSVQAGLRAVPRGATGFLLYPVDYPLITPDVVRALLRAFARHPTASIVLPTCRGHGGHPVLFRANLRREIESLGSRRTLRDVVYRDPSRIRFVPIGSEAHRADFDTPKQYLALARRFWR